jgi:hypothetical protein
MRAPRFVTVVAVIALTACAGDRYRWNLRHAQLSPRAHQLPRQDIEDIIRIVSSATPSVIIGIGQYCTDHGLDKMNVLTEYYRDDRLWIVELKKINGKWRIVDQGDVSPSLSRVAISC